MAQAIQPADIIIAEDDDDDYSLIEDAFKETEVPHRLFRVKDGEQLLDALLEPEKTFGAFVHPTLVLLDLNMPRMGGIEVLSKIKSNPLLRKIPVVILTTSTADEDIARAYDLGVNSFLQKPISFEELVHQIQVTLQYWIEVVQLPYNRH
ncbi:MAG: response regulator [Nitrospinae bacterium]|nr:response regulator [Nitrospinota bacterium]